MTANLLSSKWRTNILWYVWTGKNRFSVLTRELPQVNQGALMRILRELESEGLIVRVERGKRPAPVEYFLTDLGLSLGPLLEQLAVWGRTHGKLVKEEDQGTAILSSSLEDELCP